MNMISFNQSGLDKLNLGSATSLTGLTGLGLNGLGAAQSRLETSPTQLATELAVCQQNNIMMNLMNLLLCLMQGQQQGAVSGQGLGGNQNLAATQGIAGDQAASSNQGSTNGTSTAGNSQNAGSSTANTSNISLGSGNKVDRNQLQAYLQQKISTSKLNGFKPSDGAQHGVDGSAQSWAQFMTKLAGLESDYTNNASGDQGVFRGGSRGLFQLSFDDAQNYGLNGGKPFTAEQLADPKQNADAAVAIMESLVTRNGSISGGAGKYWGPIKRGKL